MLRIVRPVAAGGQVGILPTGLSCGFVGKPDAVALTATVPDVEANGMRHESLRHDNVEVRPIGNAHPDVADGAPLGAFGVFAPRRRTSVVSQTPVSELKE